MRLFVRLVLVLASLAFVAVAQDDLPNGKGKETLESTCTECHGLDTALSELRTAKKWREIAKEMRWKGATMTDEELDTLVEYLTQNFGAPEPTESKPAPKININKAPAIEIQTELDLKPAEAAAIVKYREAHGPFKDWRGVAEVKGVEKSKIESAKDRIVF